MKHCKRCVMPNTKPGVKLDKDGVCQACRRYERRKSINWAERFEELKQLCDIYRRNDGYYDCIIAVSGGKDSYYQIHLIKNILKMNPLLVTADTIFSTTEIGRRNFKNMCDAFDCDNIKLTLNLSTARKMTRIGFEEFGFGALPMDLSIYVFPIRVAINYNIPLVIYGENISYEYGGVQEEETCSAKEQILNTVAQPINFDYWKEKGIDKKDLNSLIYPTKEEIESSRLDPIYLSYFVPWDGYENYQIAKRYGFRDLTHEWIREGYIENYDQIDTIGYLLHAWLKYPKYGFYRVTDVACYWIRSGRMTREDAIKLIKNHDHKLDQRILDDWLEFTGYNNKEFYDILDRHYNRDIFEKINGIWRPKFEIL